MEQYYHSLEMQSQLNAIRLCSRYITSAEMGSFYSAKAGAEARLQEANDRFEFLITALIPE